jgi:hypothetical protein
MNISEPKSLALRHKVWSIRKIQQEIISANFRLKSILPGEKFSEARDREIASRVLTFFRDAVSALNTYLNANGNWAEDEFKEKVKRFLESLSEGLPKMKTREGEEAVLSLLNEFCFALDHIITLIENYLMTGNPVEEEITIECTLFNLWYEKKNDSMNFSYCNSEKPSSGISRLGWFLLGVWLGVSLDD